MSLKGLKWKPHLLVAGLIVLHSKLCHSWGTPHRTHVTFQSRTVHVHSLQMKIYWDEF